MGFILMILRLLLRPSVKSLALKLIQQAMTQFTSNEERREWVVHELMQRFHLPERAARAIVELVMLELKPLEESHLCAEPAAPNA